MGLTINLKAFLFFTITFIIFTVIGTISHEYGHIAIAKVLGYRTTLHYGSMNYNSDFNNEIVEVYEKNKVAIEKGVDFEQKLEYEQGLEKLKTDGLLITMGGPLQTTFTGLIGLLILFFRKRKIKSNELKIIDWVAVFLSLFWLREIFNLTHRIGSKVITKNGSYFGGDEKYLSQMLGLWEGTIPIILGIIGLLISLFVIFRIIPTKTRLIFIISGFIGGVLGFILWMNFLGSIIIP